MPHLITRGLGSDGTSDGNLVVSKGLGSPVVINYLLDSSLVITMGYGPMAGPVNFQSAGLTPTAAYVDIAFSLEVGPLELQAAIPSNWIFTTSGPQPVTVKSLLVISNVVRVFITEPRGGDLYTIQMPATGLKSTSGLAYNGAGFLSFTAVATAPVAAMAQSIDARKLRVIFSEPVIEADALTASNYSIIPSLTVFSVQKETDSVYILTTGPQTPGQAYTLTVINVRDTSQNPV